MPRSWQAVVASALGLGLGCTVGSSSGQDSLSSDSTGESGDASTGTDESGETGETGDPGCQSDPDCAGDPNGPVCDPETGECTPSCEPGSQKGCYTGPPETKGIGECNLGVTTCNADGTGFGPCEGEVTPEAEICGNGDDDDCDDEIDEDKDFDQDGWGVCSGDCCDTAGPNCLDPELVNPGAFEFAGNMVDDDCDGEVDEDPVACDTGLLSDSGNALDYAKAIDLCQETEEDPDDPVDRTWGVIGATLTLADGTEKPESVQRSIRPGFGDVIVAQKNDSLAVLSTGHAADTSDTDPAFAAFEVGQDLGTSVPAPADWLAANDGKFPNPLGCLDPWNTNANDSAMLTLRVRVPTNANSFSVRMYFFSAEYPEWVCSEFNDFFVTLVDSSADNPDDKNIAIYDDGDTAWPVGVNLVQAAEGLFAQCENGEVGCARSLNSDYAGCASTAELVGTGFDAIDNGNGCGDQTMVGGGTGWLVMSGNATPGEIMEVRFALWDSSGHIYDALVLLDAWEWSIDAAQPGIEPG